MRWILTVLYIEDDPDTRYLVAELLRDSRPAAGEQMEIRYFGAAGIAEAVSRYGNLQPQLILLDNRLGLEEGVEQLPYVRKVWSGEVWIVSGLLPPSLCERAERLGAAGVMTKDELLSDGQALRDFLLARCAAVTPVQKIPRDLPANAK
jgi:CheY-like chemotaxis protein